MKKLSTFLAILAVTVGQTTPKYDYNFPQLLFDGNLAATIAQDDEYDLLPNETLHFRNCPTPPEVECDFIIVGLGTAGSVIANRLSAFPDATICGFESGKRKPPKVSEVPMMAPFVHFEPDVKRYRTKKQPAFGIGLKDQRVNWPRGNVCGGSSVKNYMICTRGAEEDWDGIAGNVNDFEWSWNQTLEDYKKSEDATDLFFKDNSEIHSTTGKLSISDSRYTCDFLEPFLNAGEYKGYPSNIDYNNGNPRGFGMVQTTTTEGRRADANLAYLGEASTRPNMKIFTERYVTKIIFAGKKAKGIEYVYYKKGHLGTKIGYKCKAFAKKEVILTAGARNSPKLLMLSGIGPENVLNSKGISVKQKSTVGEKIEDHIAYFGLMIEVPSGAITIHDILDENQWDVYNYNGTGIFSSIGTVVGLGYINTETCDTKGLPDIELIFTCGFFTTDGGVGFAKAWGIDKDIYNDYYGPYIGKDIIGIIPVLMHPKSHGFMTLKSSSPFEVPEFNGNYLTDPEDCDLKTMIEAIKFTIELVESPPFQSVGAKVIDDPVPGCDHIWTVGKKSDAYWECAIRTLSTSLVHQVGPCKMGVDPKDSVTDSRGKVHGIEKLRVSDLSILPTSVSAHTYCVTIMIGEKMSRFIIEEHGL